MGLKDVQDGQGFKDLVRRIAALLGAAKTVSDETPAKMESLDFSGALETIWTLVRAANRYVEENKPWALAKNPDDSARLGTVMYNLAEACRLLSVWLRPFIPTTTAKIETQFALGEVSGNLDELSRWGLTVPGTVVKKDEPLFPRVDLPGE